MTKSEHDTEHRRRGGRYYWVARAGEAGISDGSLDLRPHSLVALLACAAIVCRGAPASAQCVDEELKQELVGKRAYRGVVPRKFKKALRHELSLLGGWYAGDLADGAPCVRRRLRSTSPRISGSRCLTSERSASSVSWKPWLRPTKTFFNIGNTRSPINMYMGHLIWTLAYGKVRWFGGPIGRVDFYLSLGAGAVDEAGSRGVAGSGGIGMKFFFTDWLGMRFDIRDQVRSVRGPLGVERTVNDITALGGLSLFIPFSS